MNNQLKRELRIYAVVMFILVMGFYFYNEWCKTIPDEYYFDEFGNEVQEPVKSTVAPPKPQQSPSTKKYVYTKVSHYDPSLGGLNCLTFVDGKCVSKLANGESWEDNFKKDVIACPREWKFGTKIKIYERIYTCKDRGSRIIKTDSGEFWIDILTDSPLVPYGQEVLAEIL